jgi:hypothetical protein
LITDQGMGDLEENWDDDITVNVDFFNTDMA